jgi:hypothetical protein
MATSRNSPAALAALLKMKSSRRELRRRRSLVLHRRYTRNVHGRSLSLTAALLDRATRFLHCLKIDISDYGQCAFVR